MEIRLFGFVLQAVWCSQYVLLDVLTLQICFFDNRNEDRKEAVFEKSLSLKLWLLDMTEFLSQSTEIVMLPTEV